LSLLGAHQARNAALAVQAALLFRPTLQEASIRAGLLGAVWPGRLEVVRPTEGPPLLLDGAHNPDGVQILVDALQAHFTGPFHLLLGAMADKDLLGMITRLAPVAASWTLTRPSNARAAAPLDLAPLIPGSAPREVIEAPGVGPPRGPGSGLPRRRLGRGVWVFVSARRPVRRRANLAAFSERVVASGMVFVRRALALTTAVALAFPVSAFAKEKPALSSLKGIELVAKSDDIVVTLEGTKAPDFTSFTMTDPFRVVVDWAGSNVDKVEAERSFDRGLVRRILTKQFNSEAEQISRVTIELARETAYQVEAEGTRVRIHFVPVPDPIPEPQPVAAPTPKVEEKVVAQAIPEGPLTEPDLPVPTDLPPLSKPKPQVVAQTPVPAPAPAPIPTPTPAPAPEPVKVAPAPAPVVAAAPVAPSKPDRKEAPAERQATPVTLASTKVEAPKALDKPAELPAPGTPAPKPAPAPTPAPVVVAKVEPKPAPPAPVVVAKVEPKPEPKTRGPEGGGEARGAGEVGQPQPARPGHQAGLVERAPGGARGQDGGAGAGPHSGLFGFDPTVGQPGASPQRQRDGLGVVAARCVADRPGTTP
jgi:hypothetical protein